VVAYCAAASDKILAQELFGSEGVGSRFEGRRRGLIESANGGTLMLRGASDLPVSLVPKIVEVIANGAFERIGGRTKLRADVRWVLSAERSGESRVGWALPDLLRIAVPTLRQRREDIQILVDRMIERFGEDHVRRISDDAMKLLRRHSFPGNVRELEGLIERACMLGDGEELLPEHFPDLEHTVH
jgi:DNA-binding NtrC family response regulator